MLCAKGKIAEICFGFPPFAGWCVLQYDAHCHKRVESYRSGLYFCLPQRFSVVAIFYFFKEEKK